MYNPPYHREDTISNLVEMVYMANEGGLVDSINQYIHNQQEIVTDKEQ